MPYLQSFLKSSCRLKRKTTMPFKALVAVSYLLRRIKHSIISTHLIMLDFYLFTLTDNSQGIFIACVENHLISLLRILKTARGYMTRQKTVR